MSKVDLDRQLESIKSGDRQTREELIGREKPFIAKVSSRTCKRYLSWENDEELSVAMLAFNEAIDRYDAAEGSGFFQFARRVIECKLVDYFRKEARHRQTLLSSTDPQEGELSEVDKRYAFEQYMAAEQDDNFAEVVDSFNRSLAEYRISLDELVKVSPKHKDTRETLMRAAQILAEDRQMLGYLYRCKQLPIKELSEAAGLSRRVLEKGRKYIITTALIFSRADLKPLRNFLQW